VAALPLRGERPAAGDEPGTTVTALSPVVRSRRAPDDGTGSGAPLPAVQVLPFQWRTCGSRALLADPTAQMSFGANPAAPFTVAQIVVGVGVSLCSVNASWVPLSVSVSVRP
jgi:hypothetical protein